MLILCSRCGVFCGLQNLCANCRSEIKNASTPTLLPEGQAPTPQLDFKLPAILQPLGRLFFKLILKDLETRSSNFRINTNSFITFKVNGKECKIDMTKGITDGLIQQVASATGLAPDKVRDILTNHVNVNPDPSTGKVSLTFKTNKLP